MKEPHGALWLPAADNCPRKTQVLKKKKAYWLKKNCKIKIFFS